MEGEGGSPKRGDLQDVNLKISFRDKVLRGASLPLRDLSDDLMV